MTQKEKKEIEQFVTDFIDSFGSPEVGFIPNEHGNYIYSYGPHSINLKCYFEMILRDYVEYKKDELEEL